MDGKRDVRGTPRRLDAVRAGSLLMSALTAEERTLLNAELDAAITARAESLIMGDLLLAEGQSIVVLDDADNLIEVHPDGTSHRLPAPEEEGAAGDE